MIEKLDFNKHPDGLIPAIIQDLQNQKVLNARLYEQRSC